VPIFVCDEAFLPGNSLSSLCNESFLLKRFRLFRKKFKVNCPGKKIDDSRNKMRFIHRKNTL